jgi:NADH-quinone oxidoreductase subunit K
VEIQLGHYLALASIFFAIGAMGFLIRSSALIQLMSIELMLNAANLSLVAFNRWSPENHQGQAFAVFGMAVAAAEAAVGLSIIITLFSVLRTVRSDRANLLKN